jgi:pyruvate dehydrogenase (quinone)
MTLNVADALVETAVRAGVERVYGVIGDSLNPVGDAIRRNGRLRWIHVRNEEVGASPRRVFDRPWGHPSF